MRLIGYYPLGDFENKKTDI